MQNTKKRHLPAKCALATFLISTPALAQNETKQKKIEKIQVTGSHIKRVDMEGPSPVVTINREDIEKTGATSVSDILRNISTNSFGSFKEASGSTAAGVATVNLRGLGSSSTLVLLDGRRLPKDPVLGAVDLNLIPMAAVERMDILKDGASAIYGSDAQGGVINIITRKDFTGSEVSARTYLPDQPGGKKQELSWVGGASDGKTSMTAVMYYRKHEAIESKDREWSKNGKSRSGSPGAYREYIDADNQGAFIPDPNCPENQISEGADGKRCSYVYANDSQEYPELEQFGIRTNFSHEFNHDLSFYLSLGATRKLSKWNFAPSPGNFIVPGSVADGMNLEGIPKGSDVEFNYRLVELGKRSSKIETNSFDVNAGFKGTIFDTIDWELSASKQRTHRFDLAHSGYALTSELQQLLKDGKFTPVADPGSRGDLSDAFYQPWQESSSTIQTTDLLVSTEIAQLPAGPLSMAMGMSFVKEEYNDQVDHLSAIGKVYSNAGSNGNGTREVKAYFTELGIPILTNLEMQLAGRVDNYSDFGSTTNPKVAIRYQALSSLMFRASWGTGFKAPGLQNLYGAQSEGYEWIVDAVSCEKEQAAGGETPSCFKQQYQTFSGGNPELKEEKSEFTNFGFVYEPTKIINFSVDYWRVKKENTVGVGLDEIIQAEQKGINLEKYGIAVDRNSSGNIKSLTAYNQNTGVTDVSGVDFNMAVRLPTSVGTFGFIHDYATIIEYKSEPFPGFGTTNYVYEDGSPRYKMNNTLSYSVTDHNVSFSARTIGEQMSINKEDIIPTHTEWDSQYNYEAPWNGIVTVGGTNIFAAKPPLDNGNPNNNFNAELYDQVGRTFYLGYKQIL